MKYTKWVKTLPCKHCKAPSDDAHHIIGQGMGKMGGKPGDLLTMPLCRGCHAEVHLGPGAYPQTRWLCETLELAVEIGVIKT